MKGMKQKLFFFNTFCTIYEKKTDSIILELKKKSFALANEGSDSEGELRDELGSEIDQQNQLPEKDDDLDSNFEEEPSDDDDSDTVGEGGYQ